VTNEQFLNLPEVALLLELVRWWDKFCDRSAQSFALETSTERSSLLAVVSIQ
jgi:hypothetical protein